MIISDINHLQSIKNLKVRGGDGWHTFFSELEDLLAPLDDFTPPGSPFNGHFASVISTTYQGGKWTTHKWDYSSKTGRWTHSSSST